MPELSIIVPTLNERENLVPLISAVDRALAGIDFEIVFVDDDSEDGTSAYLRALAQTNRRVRVLQRLSRRGLASAVVEGMLSTSSPFLAVMDGDLQHDETILPRLLDELRSSDADLAVGTRHAEGGSVGDFAAHRAALSQWGKALSRIACSADLSDPMSGFFIVRRTFLDEVAHNLSLTGFKILLDLVASSSRRVRIREVPYTFRSRRHGRSKLDLPTAFEFGILLADKLTHGILPVNYLKFGTVGAVGVLGNALLLRILMDWGVSFATGEAVSGFSVIALNYFLNNIFTFRLHRLTGARWWTGLALFSFVCGLGLTVNLSVASFLMQSGMGALASGGAGIVLASVWNYYISSILVWQFNRRRRTAPVPELSPAGIAEANAIYSRLD